MEKIMLAVVLSFTAWGLTSLVGCTKVVKPVPVQYSIGGESLEYIHGAHCIDGRSF